MADVLTHLFYIIQKVNTLLVPTELEEIVDFLKGHTALSTPPPPAGQPSSPLDVAPRRESEGEGEQTRRKLRVGLSLWNDYIPLAVVPESFNALLSSTISAADGAGGVLVASKGGERDGGSAGQPPHQQLSSSSPVAAHLHGAALPSDKVGRYFEEKGFQRVFQHSLADGTASGHPNGNGNGSGANGGSSGSNSNSSRREARLAFVEGITSYCEGLLRASRADVDVAMAGGRAESKLPTLRGLARRANVESGVGETLFMPSPSSGIGRKRSRVSSSSSASHADSTHVVAPPSASVSSAFSHLDAFVQHGSAHPKQAAKRRETYSLLFIIMHSPSEERSSSSSGGGVDYNPSKGGHSGNHHNSTEAMLFSVLHEIHSLYQLYRIKSKNKALQFHFSVLLLPESVFSHNNYTNLIMRNRLEVQLSSFYHIHLFEKKQQHQRQQQRNSNNKSIAYVSEDVERVLAILRVWDAPLLDSFYETRNNAINNNNYNKDNSGDSNSKKSISEKKVWETLLRDPLLFFLRPQNVYLSVFLSECLRRFPSLLFMLLHPRAHVLARIKSMYCFRHQLEDVALLAQQLLSPFAFWNSLQQQQQQQQRGEQKQGHEQDREPREKEEEEEEAEKEDKSVKQEQQTTETMKTRKRNHFSELTNDSVLVLNALFDIAHVVQGTVAAAAAAAAREKMADENLKYDRDASHDSPAGPLVKEAEMTESVVFMLLVEEVIHKHTQRLFRFEAFQDSLLSIYDKECSVQHRSLYLTAATCTSCEAKPRGERIRLAMQHLLPCACDHAYDECTATALYQLQRRPTNVKLSVSRTMAQFLLQYVELPSHALQDLSLLLERSSSDNNGGSGGESSYHNSTLLTLNQNFFNSEAIPNNVRLLYLLVMHYYFNLRNGSMDNGNGSSAAQQRSRGGRQAQATTTTAAHTNTSGVSSRGNVSFYYLKCILQVSDEELLLLLKELEVAGCVQLNLKTESVKLLLTSYF